MIILYVIMGILALLLLLIFWVIMTSLILYINTDQNMYYLKLTSIAKIQLIFDEKLFLFRLRIFFLNFNIDPFKFSKKKKRKKEFKPEMKKRKSHRFTFSQGRKLVIDIIASFKIKRLSVEIDSGDVVTNAWLVPAFIFANRSNIHLSVNNSGLNSFELKLQNRIIKLLYIFLKFLIHKKVKF